MAAVAVPLLPQKKRLNVRKDAALDFINTIESPWKGHEPFVFWLVKRLKPKTVVDLGFGRALSTIAFAYRNRGHVFGIDWFEEGDYAKKCITLDTAFQNVSNALRFHYVKNIHLIIGPFKEVSKNWNRKIDILHIDAHTYATAKQHYENWKSYLTSESVLLVHDIRAFPLETGRFFDELPMHKIVFPHAEGLGVAAHDPKLIEQIREKFF